MIKNILRRFGLLQETETDRLRARADRAELLLRTATLEKKAKLAESILPGGIGSLVNPLDLFYNGLRPLQGLWPGFQQRDAKGQILPGAINLDFVRQEARDLVDRNPYGAGLLRGLRAFVLGHGFQYSLKAEDGKNVSEDDLAIWRRILKCYVDEVDFFRIEEDIFNRAVRDGECFTRVTPNEECIADIRCLLPEHIAVTKNAAAEDTWGVRTDENDVQKILGYWCTYIENLIPAEEMVFIKRNVDLDVKRGISDYYAACKPLDNGFKLQDNSAQGEAIRQCYAFIQQYSGVQQAEIQASLDAASDFQMPVVRFDGSSRDLDCEITTPGSTPVINKGLEFKEPPKGNGEGATMVLGVTLNAAAVRWNAPSWLLAADAGTSFASSLVAESPFVRTVEREQHLFGRAFRDILWKVLRIAEDQGIGPRILDDVDLLFRAPPVAVRDRDKETDTNSKLNQASILSRRTWTSMLNLDWDTEQAHLSEEGGPAPLPAAPPANLPSDTPSAQKDQLAPRIERPAD